MNMVAALTLLSSLTFNVNAVAATSCSAESFAPLKKAIFAQNQVPGVLTAPAIVYNGLNAAQISANKAAGTAESQYVTSVWNHLGLAAKAFLEADGLIEPAAVKILGAPSRRQAVAIYKRADSNSASSTSAKCGSGSCQDIALEVTALHLVEGKSLQAVMDLITSAKLATIKPATVSFCETGATCLSRDHVVPGNAKVQQLQSPSPMRLNTYYTARETASSPLGPKVDNTSIYRVTSFDLCGHQAMLMAGVSTREQNSFLNSSSDVLAIEANGKVMTIALAQGVAPQKGDVAKIFLNGLFGGMARKTLVTGYNEESKRLGTNEGVDKNGFLD